MAQDASLYVPSGINKGSARQLLVRAIIWLGVVAAITVVLGVYSLRFWDLYLRNALSGPRLPGPDSYLLIRRLALLSTLPFGLFCASLLCGRRAGRRIAGAAIFILVVAIATVFYPTAITHSTAGGPMLETWTVAHCKGLVIRYYPPGAFDYPMTDYCIGLETPFRAEFRRPMPWQVLRGWLPFGWWPF